MPLAKRIIPTLLVRGRQLVKGERFTSWELFEGESVDGRPILKEEQ